jgi:hypothetical protein
MVGEVWIYVSYNWIPCLLNLRHCWFINWYWKASMVILTRCHLQLNNLNKLLFVKKNGLMTLRLVVNLFFNLVELFETDAKLEEIKKIWRNIWKGCSFGNILYNLKSNIFIIFYTIFFFSISFQLRFFLNKYKFNIIQIVKVKYEN